MFISVTLEMYLFVSVTFFFFQITAIVTATYKNNSAELPYQLAPRKGVIAKRR